MHISRLGGFFRKYHPAESAAEAFNVLGWLYEAVELGDGFWIAAPPLAVSFKRFNLLLTPQPTSELQRHCSRRLRNTAFGRLIPDEIPRFFENINSSVWLPKPNSHVEWSKEVFSALESQLKPSTAVGRLIQVFRSWRNPSVSNDLFHTWRENTSRESIPDGLHLARELSVSGMRRYFIGKFKGSHLVQESDVPCDPIRLRFAVDKACGIAMPLRVRSDAQSSWFDLKIILPNEETRLLLALVMGVEQLTSGLRLSVDKDVFLEIKPMLEDLGLAIKET